MKKLLFIFMLAWVAIAVHATDYQLWINGTQVTSENAKDLSVIDGVTGRVFYLESVNRLTLINATITGADNSNIRNDIDGLKINVVGTNTLKITSGAYASLSVRQPLTIIGGGTLNVEGNQGAGCYVYEPLTIQDGVKVKFTGAYGIYGNGYSATLKLIVSGANTVVTANGSTGCIYRTTPELNDGLSITQPAGAYFGDFGIVYDADGEILKGQDVVISRPGPYAIYDASTTTLTFAYGDKPKEAYNLNAGESQPGWYYDGTNANVTKVVFDPSFADARPTSTCGWFYYMTNLTEITGWENLNTSEVTNMNYMFQNCSLLTSLDLRSFNTAKVKFMNCMFFECTNLESLNVSSFNTANVTEMGSMFGYCSNLKELDLSNFDTGKVTLIGGMFTNCSSLTSLDLSGFNTAKATYLTGMFEQCYALKSLDLSGFNTANVTSMMRMFLSCSSLTTIYVGDGWNTDAVTSSSDMFYKCTKIKGDFGTTYDANHVDKEYARLDGGPRYPGYLSQHTGLRGDLNDDSKVDVSDVNIMIDMVLGKQAKNIATADLTGDGNVDVSDVSVLIDIVLGKN